MYVISVIIVGDIFGLIVGRINGAIVSGSQCMSFAGFGVVVFSFGLILYKKDYALS